MGNGRRGVKFSHRKGNGILEGRRASMSEASEAGSQEPSSPSRSRSSLQPKDVAEKDGATQIGDYEKKKANFIERTLWTLIMIAGFFTALFMGHIYIIVIITIIQVMSFKEVIAIASVPTRARQLRSTKSLNWYWLATTMYFLYGESVIYYFKHIVLVDKILLPLATHHRFISFMLYIIGFVFFVTSLKAGHLKFQFTQFAWTHMALLIIVVQAHFIMNNLLEGLIWFFLPATLVITNDIWAYICGITFGRTQLIKLSPKKTVEGFVGAWVMTVVFGYVLTNLMVRSGYFICPVTDFGANVFTGLQCDPNPVFLPYTYEFPEFVFLPANATFSFTMAPIQMHTMVFATFASLIAPFGGFFASGLKRTFKIKDFGHSIPGHGGMTDRMDCQFIMGFFTFMYYHSFIATYKVGLGGVMEQAINGLTVDDQIELVKNMAKYLVNQGAFESDVLSCIDSALPTKR